MVCDQEEEEGQRERCNPDERPSDVCPVIREMETCLTTVTLLPSSSFTPNLPTGELYTLPFIPQPSLAFNPAGYAVPYHSPFTTLCIVLASNSYRTGLTLADRP